MEESRKKIYLNDEKPLIELPGLILFFIIIFSFLLGLSLLVMPWYIPLALVLMVGIIAGIFINPYLGVVIFIAGAFLHPTQYITALRDFHLAITLAIMVSLTLGFHTLVYRDLKFVKAPQNVLIIILGGLYFLSSLRYPDYSLSFFLEFIPKILIVYFLIILLVKTRTQAVFLFWVLFALAIIVSIAAIIQHKMGLGLYYRIEGITRVSGTEVDPNFFAIQLVMLVPILLYLFLAKRNLLIRALLLFGLGLLLLAVVFTYSRTGMLALLFSLAIFVVKPVFSKQKNWIPLICAILAIIMFLPFIPQKYWERVKTITDFEDPAIRARLDTWRIGAEIITENPIIGIGYGAFKFEYGERAASSPYVDTKAYLVAHNSYVELGAESGLLALLVFFALIIYTFNYLKKARENFIIQRDYYLYHLTCALENSFYVFLIGAFFLSIMHLMILWIVLGLAVVMKNVSDHNNAEFMANL
ncbi:MAG: O-antigen ligase family protein [Candidatus Omnitrophota bacterium]